MKTKVIAVHLILAMTEIWSRWCQNLGRFSSLRARTSSDRTSCCIRIMALQMTLILVLFFGVPAVLCAQSPKGAWSNLNRLKAGQRIDVIESSVKSHTGEFITVTDEALTLKEHGTNVSLNRENVVRVSTGSGYRRGEHAVIGLAIGGLIGAGVGAAAGSSGSKTEFLGVHAVGVGALVGVAIGGSAGALVGAAIPAHTTVYRVAPALVHQTGASHWGNRCRSQWESQ